MDAISLRIRDFLFSVQLVIGVTFVLIFFFGDAMIRRLKWDV